MSLIDPRDRAIMLDLAATEKRLERRYSATDVWAEGYKAGVHDARGERASAVSSAFAVGIAVGGIAATLIGFLLLRGVT
jgi:hypothetical protein